MGTLKVTDGKLDLKSVESLSRRELGEWIDARLHGQDTQVPGDARQGEMPHYLIKLIYPNLDRSTRQDIENTTLDFVRDMARNPNTVWRGDAADELLLLAQSIGSNKAVTYLREMAEDRRYFHSEQQERAGDIHYRLLQSLVALGWHGTPKFWREQASLAPNRYAGVAFDGLALTSLRGALWLLTQIPWIDEIEDQILTSLPDLLEVYGASRIVAGLESSQAAMPERAKAAIRGFIAEEEEALSGLSPIPDSSGRAVVEK